MPKVVKIMLIFDASSANPVDVGVSHATGYLSNKQPHIHVL
jgi:hypothetical protein